MAVGTSTGQVLSLGGRHMGLGGFPGQWEAELQAQDFA